MMDSVTQIVLGSTVALVASPTTASSLRKVVIIGAVIATLPDLDIIIRSESDLHAFTNHRTWSHSWFVQTAVAPLIAAAVYRYDNSISYIRWLLTVWLVLVTHSLIDSLTTFGTALFWPIDKYRLSFDTISIIDPLYTLPLLLVFIMSWRKKFYKKKQKLQKYGAVALFLSTLYLGWGWSSHQYISSFVEKNLDQKEIEYEKYLVTPTLANSVKWRILVLNDENYFESFFTWGKSQSELNFTKYSRNTSLLGVLKNHPNFDLFDDFSHGFNKAIDIDSKIYAIDLRIGNESCYPFLFELANHDTVLNSYVLSSPTVLHGCRMWN